MDRVERKQSFIDLANLIDSAGSTYRSYFNEVAKDSHHGKIVELESRGDVIEDKLNEYYTSQKNIPYLSLDRARLLAKLDEILDQILLGSKTLGTFGSSLPSDFQEKAKDLGKNVDDITTMIKDAVITIYENFQQASEITQNIEEIRDRASINVYELEKYYFSTEGAVKDWKNYIAVTRIARRTMGIISATKDASEIIKLMTMKYL